MDHVLARVRASTTRQAATPETTGCASTSSEGWLPRADIELGGDDPENAVDEYFCRIEIESFFKTSKDCLDLPPQDRWTETTVRGKVSHDVICTVANAGKSQSPKALFGKASSVMCSREGVVRGDGLHVPDEDQYQQVPQDYTGHERAVT